MGKLVNISNNGFKVKNVSDSEAEITIYAPIGDSFWDDSVSATSFCKELDALPSSVKTINVRLNSPGGDVFDGQTIYNRLKSHSAKVIVHVDGIAASIASIIAMAGDEIIMGEGSQMMIHKPMMPAFGNSLELQEAIDILDRVEEQLIGIYARRTNIDKTTIKSKMRKDFWMNAEEAIDLGFANRSMETVEARRVAAFDISKMDWITNKTGYIAPSATEHIKQKISETLSSMREFLDN